MEKFYEVEEEKEQVSDSLANLPELQGREGALLRGFVEARNNAQEINAPKDRVEQEASDGNQIKIRPSRLSKSSRPATSSKGAGRTSSRRSWSCWR